MDINKFAPILSMLIPVEIRGSKTIQILQIDARQKALVKTIFPKVYFI